MKLFYLFLIFVFTVSSYQYSQEKKQEIDPSKPTNLYTQVNANLEYTSGESYNLYGIRANVNYAINPDNLFLIEVPFLYHDVTKKFGIGDMRIRYFSAVKRNISPNFIAIAPFADISIPTGSFENRLGSSAWSLAAGCVFGFVASKQMALFPGLSIIYVTKPGTDLIPDSLKKSSAGIGFQFNLSYSFSKTTYMFINPTPNLLNTDGVWKSGWSGEFSINHIFVPNKFKMNLNWNPNFTAKAHTFRLGGTFYL